MQWKAKGFNHPKCSRILLPGFFLSVLQDRLFTMVLRLEPN